MSRRPNILLITVDQQRYDCIGYSRRAPVRTPHIDRLADQGMWFSQAYTPIPICSPARQSLINGRRPEAIGGLWNYHIGLKIPALSPEEYAWPRELATRGYRTAFFGKWGVHPQFDPTHYGYDIYVGVEQYEAFHRDHAPEVNYSNGFFGEPDPTPLGLTRTHWLAQQAVDALQQFSAADGEPWHIALHFAEPHLPCRPAEPFASMYDPAYIPEWDSFRDTFENKPYIQKQQLLNWGVQDYTWQDWAPIVARYYAMVSQIDDAIGQVLRALEEAGAKDDTLILFTSDHGDLCGGHRMMDKHYVLYDDVVRVPFIASWPGMIAPGQVCDRFVYSFLDLPPTILELLTAEVPSFFHGTSMLPLWRGEPMTDWRDAVVSTFNGQQFGLYTQRMIRTAEWKYIWNTTDKDELYDMLRDTGELHNAIDIPENKPVVAELRKKLYEQLMSVDDGLVQNHWLRDQLLMGTKL